MIEEVKKIVPGTEGTVYANKTSNEYFKKCVKLAKKYRQLLKKMGLKHVLFNYMDKDYKVDNKDNNTLSDHFLTMDVFDVSGNKIVSFTLRG